MVAEVVLIVDVVWNLIGGVVDFVVVVLVVVVVVLEESTMSDLVYQ